MEWQGINWYISPLFWTSILFFFFLKRFDNKKLNCILVLVMYFCFVVNIQYNDGGFGRETVYGFINLGVAQATGGLCLGYFIGMIERLGRFYFENINFSTKESRILRPVIYVVCSLLELGLLLFLVGFFVLGLNYQSKIVVVICFAAILVLFLQKKGAVSHALDHKIFGWTGKYAYSVYVMQQISFWILRRSLWKNAAFVENVPLCLFFSLLFSISIGIATYYLVERPAVRLYARIKEKIKLKECEML